MSAIDAERPRSVIWHLALLCIAITLPALLFAGLMIDQYARTEWNRNESEAVSRARELAAAVDKYHIQVQANLTFLANDPALHSGDLDAFDRRARLNLMSYGYNVALFDGEGRHLVNTRLARGTPLPHTRAKGDIGQVFATRRSVITGVFTGGVASAPVYAVIVPVVVGNDVRYALGASLPPEGIRALIMDEALPPDWDASVGDSKGVIVARRTQHEDYVGKPGSAESIREATGESGIWRGRNIAGEDVVVPYFRLPASGWIAGVSVPERLISAPVYRLLWPVVLLTAVLVGMSIALIAFLAHRLAGALNQLVVLAKGETANPDRAKLTPVTEINEIGEALTRAWAERAASDLSLRESDTRLRQALSIGGAYAFTYDPRTDRVERIGAEAVLGPLDAETDREFVERLHPDDRPSAINFTKDATPDKPLYVTEYRFNRSDGRQIWLRETGEAEFASSGELLRHHGIVIDITPLKQADAALRESDARFRQIAETVDQGFYLLDLEPAPRIVYVSPACGRIWGRAADTMLGDPWAWATGIHAEDKAKVDSAFARWLAAPETRFEEEYRIVRPDGGLRWIHDTGSPVHDAGGKVTGLAGTATDITERKRARDIEMLLIGELNHRVKNMLATIQAIAGQTLRRAAGPEEFVTSFNGRLRALARANDLLAQSSWQGASLAEIVREQLLVGAEDADRISASGPAVVLDPQTALHLALVLHELGTNARKYGALSTPKGHLAITWNVRSRTPEPAIVVTWMERGGPPVSAPQRRGFGTTLIERSLLHSPGGEASIAYDPKGVVCRIVLPLSAQSTTSGDVAA